MKTKIAKSNISFAKGGELIKCACITRHALTEEQKQLLHAMGLEPVMVGDTDAFNPDFELVSGFSVFMAVHPMLVAQFCGTSGYASLDKPWAWRTAIVFKNDSRPAEGGKPQFETTQAWLIEPMGRDDGLGGLTTRLGAKLVDDDGFRQCHECGNNVNIFYGPPCCGNMCTC